jgi:hypothetical protein
MAQIGSVDIGHNGIGQLDDERDLMRIWQFLPQCLYLGYFFRERLCTWLNGIVWYWLNRHDTFEGIKIWRQEQS